MNHIVAEATNLVAPEKVTNKKALQLADYARIISHFKTDKKHSNEKLQPFRKTIII